MDFDTSETLRRPVRALDTARDLVALTGQRVWFVRQVGYWGLREATKEVRFYGSNLSVILEWRVGPLVRPVDPCVSGQPRLAPVSREDAVTEHRLFNIDWTGAHLRLPRVQMIHLSSYLSPHITGRYPRFGASAVFANEADAKAHQALLQVFEERSSHVLGDLGWMCEVVNETLPPNFYRSLDAARI